MYDLLNITPKDFSLGRWPKNALEILNASFSTQEKRIIRNEHQFIPRDIKKVLDTQLLGIHKTPLFNAKSLKPEQYRFSFSNKYPKELREQYTKISKNDLFGLGFRLNSNTSSTQRLSRRNTLKRLNLYKKQSKYFIYFTNYFQLKDHL